jgi:hypothetical protein
LRQRNTAFRTSLVVPVPAIVFRRASCVYCTRRVFKIVFNDVLLVLHNRQIHGGKISAWKKETPVSTHIYLQDPLFPRPSVNPIRADDNSAHLTIVLFVVRTRARSGYNASRRVVCTRPGRRRRKHFIRHARYFAICRHPPRAARTTRSGAFALLLSVLAGACEAAR